LINPLYGEIRAGYPGIMGILRNSITRPIDLRFERDRMIESLEVRRRRRKSLYELVCEISCDLVQRTMALLFLLASSPILFLVSLWIMFDSPGPIFFRQERMGLGGRIFKIVKFRTMIYDAERETGPVLARVGDERVTYAGRILRHLRIDEIPQMWNVLMGQMALVGPRPERPEIYDSIITEMPEFFKRLEVKPGISGLAQIRGDYHTEPKDKLRYDLLYIKRRSLWLDVRIIAITMYICLLKKGAC